MTMLTNTIKVNCPVGQLFGYVTQPWFWHEWHPNSISATQTVDVLNIGDKFEEKIELKPLKFLPFKLKRLTHYQVKEVIPHQKWVVEGHADNGGLMIKYEFLQLTQGTQFTRTLSFKMSGIHRLLMPLLKSYLKETSVIALNNLKNQLETTT